MKRVLSLAVALLSAIPLAAEPSLLLLRGRVFTGDPNMPWAEAVAIEGERITAVGTTADLAKLAGPSTRVIDAGNRLVIPGLNDAHTHPGNVRDGYVVRFDSPGFPDPAPRDVITALRAASEEVGADTWIFGEIGPTALLDPKFDASVLDRAAAGRKVALTSFTGHGTLFSSAALRDLGVKPDVADPTGGWYERDANGKLTGKVQEYAAMALLRQLNDRAPDDALVASIRDFSAEAMQYGITSVQAMAEVSERRFLDALKTADVPLRVRVINYPVAAPPFNVVRGANGVKWILDGTPIERGASVRTAYKAGGTGRLNFNDLAPLMRVALDAKQQLLMHSSGDKTAETLLKAMQSTNADWPALRPRIEHGDGLAADLLPLAKRLGVIVVQNPTHFPARGYYPKGDYFLSASLKKAGIPIAIGSDGPMNPFLNMMFAVDRRDLPGEALSREDALLAYTSGSAFAELAENDKGTLAPGKLADLAVLSQDILKVPAEELPATRSVLTVISGKIVYENY
ncbi:MAG TPA: amidohydrolase family protein [Thermoanaerobaculia bacterium]|jgi:hypothetical protein